MKLRQRKIGTDTGRKKETATRGPCWLFMPKNERVFVFVPRLLKASKRLLKTLV